MRCNNCGNSNPDEAKFCMECGSEVNRICITCKMKLPDGAKFCYSCGAKQEEGKNDNSTLSQYIPKELLDRMKEAEKLGGLQNERRVVTILFCDLQGSTAAAEQLDPEEWTDIMNGAFEYLIKPVYKYEGVLARLMGDAILAFFGAPIAHEDDPERAILTGLDILAGIKPYLKEVKSKWDVDVNTRIGINTGLVVVGEIGSDMRVEYSAMGDAVNLASRMESTAIPGTIQVSENTKKLVSQIFELKELGEQTIKGKQAPIKTFQVTAKKEIRGVIRGIEGFTSPMVGRSKEYMALKHNFIQLIEGKGKILSLTGDAGLGKTRLVNEIYSDLKDNNHIIESITALKTESGGKRILWLHGRSLSYQANSPYAPIVNLLARFFELNELNIENGSYQKVKSILSTFEDCEDLAPFLANLLQIEIDENDKDVLRYLEPPALKVKTMDALMFFLETLAINNPLAIILDDLHWVDSSSFDFIKSLFELAHKEKILLLGIYRQRRDALSWEFHTLGTTEYDHLYERINVNPISTEETNYLIRQLLHEDELDEKIANLIIKQSDGNPFYIEEVLRSLIDQSIISEVDGIWKIHRTASTTSVPSTLIGVLTSRLDQLDEDSKRMAQIASVIGRVFRVDVLNDIYKGNLSISQSLGKLGKREMVEIISRIPIRVYSFKHALFHEIVYNSLLIKTRRDLHNKIAKCIEKINPKNFQEIARHYYEAQEFENAFPNLIKAANLASQTYSSSDSIQLYLKAKDIMDLSSNNPNDVKDLFLGLGKHYSFRGQFSDAIEIFEELLDIGKSVKHAECQVTALNQLGLMSALIIGDLGLSDKYLREAEEIARTNNLDMHLAECFMIKCNVETATAKFDNLEDHLLEAVKIGERYDANDAVMYGRTHVSNTLIYMTRFDDAHDYIQQSMDVIEKNGNKVFLSELKSFAFPLLETIRGNIYSAHNSATEGMQIGAEIGYATSQMYAGMILIDTNLLLGRFSETERMIDFTFKMTSTIGIKGFMAYAKSCYVSLQHEIGETEQKAEQIFEEVFSYMDGDMGKFLGGRIWTTYGFHLLHQGKLDKAMEYFDKAKKEPNTLMYLYRPVALIGQGYIALQKQDLESADKLVKEIKELIFDKKVKYLQPQAYQMIGDYEDAKGNQPQCILNYEKGEKEAEDMGMKPILWKLKASIARSYKKAGEIEKANVKITEAKRIIEELSTNFADPSTRKRYMQFSQANFDLVES